MKTWIWPLSWYCRIRELEAQVAALKQMNDALDSRLRAQAMMETSMHIVYASSLAAMAATYQNSAMRALPDPQPAAGDQPGQA